MVGSPKIILPANPFPYYTTIIVNIHPSDDHWSLKSLYINETRNEDGRLIGGACLYSETLGGPDHHVVIFGEQKRLLGLPTEELRSVLLNSDGVQSVQEHVEHLPLVYVGEAQYKFYRPEW